MKLTKIALLGATALALLILPKRSTPKPTKDNIKDDTKNNTKDKALNDTKQ